MPESMLRAVSAMKRKDPPPAENWCLLCSQNSGVEIQKSTDFKVFTCPLNILNDRGDGVESHGCGGVFVVTSDGGRFGTTIREQSLDAKGLSKIATLATEFIRRRAIDREAVESRARDDAERERVAALGIRWTCLTPDCPRRLIEAPDFITASGRWTGRKCPTCGGALIRRRADQVRSAGSKK